MLNRDKIEAVIIIKLKDDFANFGTKNLNATESGSILESNC